MAVYGLGDKLKKLRNVRNLSQQDVADQTGIARTSLHSYESGANSPSLEALLLLANFYNVSCDYLLGISSKNAIVLDSFDTEQQEIIMSAVYSIIDSFKDITNKK